MEQQLLEELETKRKLQEEEESRKMVSHQQLVTVGYVITCVVVRKCFVCFYNTWYLKCASVTNCGMYILYKFDLLPPSLRVAIVLCSGM